MSWAEQTFLAEEIAGNVNIQIGEVVPNVINTKEIRPRHARIINYSIHQANVWNEIKIPQEIRAWSLRCREKYDINYCFEPSHATYMTLSKGAVINEDTSPQGVQAIYVRSPVANITIELELWE